MKKFKEEKAELAKFWKPKIEGQLRDTIHQHPEWFLADKKKQKSLIQSAAKRIIGEIIANT